jgi:parallel beta-helix repeat protein
MEKGIWANHIFSNEIQNNRIINSLTGISIWNSYENSVSNNYIEGDKEGYGISLMASSVFNQIDNNYITKKKTGIYTQNSFENMIFDNTLIDNFFDALTDTNNFKTNNWNHNYWSRTRVFPKIIFGTTVYGPTPNFIFFPWFEIDRNPAKEPFVISK